MIEKLEVPDIIFQNPKTEKWHFWYETWAEYSPAYETEEITKEKLDKYCKEVLGYNEGF